MFKALDILTVWPSSHHLCCGADLRSTSRARCAAFGDLVGMCCRFDVAPSTVSHHLKELRTAGLVDMERRGRWVYVNVNKNALNALRAFAENPGAGAACGAPASATEC